MKTKKELASEKFQSGYNCAQSILHTFRDEGNLDEDTALKMATGLGAALLWTLLCSDLSLYANQPNSEVFINAWLLALMVKTGGPERAWLRRYLGIGALCVVRPAGGKLEARLRAHHGFQDQKAINFGNRILKIIKSANSCSTDD